MDLLTILTTCCVVSVTVALGALTHRLNRHERAIHHLNEGIKALIKLQENTLLWIELVKAQQEEERGTK
jgi:rhamnogalacturonyl hydrolase YesR